MVISINGNSMILKDKKSSVQAKLLEVKGKELIFDLNGLKLSMNINEPSLVEALKVKGWTITDLEDFLKAKNHDSAYIVQRKFKDNWEPIKAFSSEKEAAEFMKFLRFKDSEIQVSSTRVDYLEESPIVKIPVVAVLRYDGLIQYFDPSVKQTTILVNNKDICCSSDFIIYKGETIENFENRVRETLLKMATSII